MRINPVMSMSKNQVSFKRYVTMPTKSSNEISGTPYSFDTDNISYINGNSLKLNNGTELRLSDENMDKIAQILNDTDKEKAAKDRDLQTNLQNIIAQLKSINSRLQGLNGNASL